MKQTATEWLAEKYNYITWLRNRDEISSEQGDGMRTKYLEEAKEMEQEQIRMAFIEGKYDNKKYINSETYYQETYEEE